MNHKTTNIWHLIFCGVILHHVHFASRPKERHDRSILAFKALALARNFIDIIGRAFKQQN
jgi:hypothetical protein